MIFDAVVSTRYFNSMKSPLSKKICDSIAMSIEGYISTALLIPVPLYYLYLRASCRSKNQSVLPTNGPVLHMFPSFLSNLHNLHDYFTLVLAGSSHSFRVHGPQLQGAWTMPAVAMARLTRLLLLFLLPDYQLTTFLYLQLTVNYLDRRLFSGFHS